MGRFNAPRSLAPAPALLGVAIAVLAVLDMVKRHVVLLAVAAAMILMYAAMTGPALARKAKVAERERQAVERVRALRDEAKLMDLQVQALEAEDPILIERAVRARFQQGGESPVVK